MENASGFCVASREDWEELAKFQDKDGKKLNEAYLDILKTVPGQSLVQRLVLIMDHYCKNVEIYDNNPACARVLTDVLRNKIGPNLPG